MQNNQIVHGFSRFLTLWIRRDLEDSTLKSVYACLQGVIQVPLEGSIEVRERRIA